MTHQNSILEHDWRPPTGEGNIWLCMCCGATIVWNGKSPFSPIDDPYYEALPPKSGYTMVLPYLDGQFRDCNLEQTRKLLNS